MTCLISLFDPICNEIESELKEALKGLFGGIVRNYLPQQWIFKTDLETVTLYVDIDGNTQVKDGLGSTPDVTIDSDHEYLSTILRMRDRPSFPQKWFNVSFQTPKGETAFNFLRGRFGL
jgi:hypothetical protein